jgi:hypothetical protein
VIDALPGQRSIEQQRDEREVQGVHLRDRGRRPDRPDGTEGECRADRHDRADAQAQEDRHGYRQRD